ncbi:MAG: hypothetical protein GWP05_05690 [Anaerolineaceae bacterium]|nr:hypothetical protein [Anaerolineaceae bacterium]
MAPSSTKNRGMIPLPRPYVMARVLQVAAVLWLFLAVAGIVCLWSLADSQTTSVKLLHSIAAALAGLTVSGLLLALAMIVRYNYNTAINIRLAERRHLSRESGSGADLGAGITRAEVGRVVSLLREINENTLLDDQEKVHKRTRLAQARCEQMKVEIDQLIRATKWPAARALLEEFQACYPDNKEARRLADQLATAVKEHRDVDVMSTSEQIRSYMTLGLWDKARLASGQLSAKYPDDPEARKMQKVILLEEQEHQKEDRLRLYREIEHLVNRKHYRDARKTAQVLLDRYADSPEAATLRGQMDELRRNADIETRREMEAQIIEYTTQNRHKEAYELAAMLMEQYPESPQAIALADTIDRLREKAGIN